MHGYRNQEQERRQKRAAETCRPHGYDKAVATITLAIACAQRWAKCVHGVQIGAGEALALIADHYVAVRKGGANVRRAGPLAPEEE